MVRRLVEKQNPIAQWSSRWWMIPTTDGDNVVIVTVIAHHVLSKNESERTCSLGTSQTEHTTYPGHRCLTPCYGWRQQLLRQTPTGWRACDWRPWRCYVSGDHIVGNVRFPRLRSLAHTRTTAYRRRRRVSGPWEPLSFTRSQQRVDEWIIETRYGGPQENRRWRNTRKLHTSERRR